MIPLGAGPADSPVLEEQHILLDMFFNPRSVAVIGASRTPGKLGYAVLSNVVQHGYRGAVYPINPKAGEIMGFKCYPTVLLAPDPIDLAIFVLPSQLVAQALVECGEKGVKGAIVISAGFREVGAEGWKRERELVDIARRYGMRLLGPNCLGIIDTASSLNASFATGMPLQGNMAFMSQSGALCTSVLDMALTGGVGFSHFISLGNKADADEITFIRAWSDDPRTQVIMAYLEGIEDGAKFMRVCRQVSRHKTILVIKSGTTSAGSRAVASHTGTLAGAERAYEAAFRQSGVIRADSVQDLFDYALAFAHQPLLPNDHIAIVTNAGGPGIMATDACQRAGLQLASFEPGTMAALRGSLPRAASVLNPVDLLGDAGAERYGLVLQEIIQDPNVGGVLVILTPQMSTQVEETARVVGALSQECEKPVFACFMGRQTVEPGIRLLQQAGVPNYPIPERAVGALAAMMGHRRWRERLPLELETFEVERDRVRTVRDQVRAEGRVTMGDAEALEIMRVYGLATPITFMARSPQEAVRFASEIGFPVALKIAAPDILHKTDVGGVKLGITTPNEVRDAFRLMTYRARRHLPDAEIRGCLVQEMVQDGKEVIMGMVRDPHFGPMMSFRLGGIYGEALGDAAFRVAPIDRRDAREMITEVRARSLRPNLSVLADALLRFSQLALDFPEIVEFDINALAILGEERGLVGIDMCLVLS